MKNTVFPRTPKWRKRIKTNVWSERVAESKSIKYPLYAMSGFGACIVCVIWLITINSITAIFNSSIPERRVEGASCVSGI